MTIRKKILGALATAIVVLLIPMVAAANYVVILKDGTRISARERFKVQGDNAIITLTNGTVTQIALSRLDIGASDRASAAGVSDAVPIGGPPASTKPSAGDDRSGPSLAEIAKQHKLAKEKKTREETKTGKSVAPTLSPYADRDVANAFFSELEKAGFTGSNMWQGTAKEFLRIDITTDREEQVFQALQVVAKRYQEMKGATASAPQKIELVLRTTSGENAGELSFSMPEIQPLLSGQLTPQEFYMKNVQI